MNGVLVCLSGALACTMSESEKRLGCINLILDLLPDDHSIDPVNVYKRGFRMSTRLIELSPMEQAVPRRSSQT